MLIHGTDDARGFRQWEKVGRKVKKGAKAFYILAPTYVPKARTELDPDTDEEKVVKYQQIIGFRAVPVFKYEDTQGAELPEHVDQAPAEPPLLYNIAEKLGIDVKYKAFIGGYYGCTNSTDRITLCSHDSRVFFHELAHCLHARTMESRVLKGGQVPAQEIVAEFTAVILSELYGMPADYKDHGFHYIKGYAAKLDKQPFEAVTRFFADISKVLQLLEELGAEVPETSTTRPQPAPAPVATPTDRPAADPQPAPAPAPVHAGAFNATIERKALLRAVQALKSVVPRKTTMDILKGVWLHADPQGHHPFAAATDLDSSVRLSLNLQGHGSAVLELKALEKALKGTTEKVVTLSGDSETTKLHAGGMIVSIPCFDLNDYPVLNMDYIKEKKPVTLTCGNLLEQLSQVKHAAGHDEDRPILQGVLFKGTGRTLTTTATNGHYLAESIEKAHASRKLQAVVPGKTADILCRIFKANELIAGAFYSDRAVFTQGNNKIACRLVEGTYPEYENVIPRDNYRKAVLNRLDLLNTLKPLDTFASSITHRVRFNMDEKEIALTAYGEDGNKAQNCIKMISAKKTRGGDTFLNAAMVLSTLKAISSSKVKLSLDGPETGVIVEPDPQPGRSNFKAVIMPLRYEDK